MVMEDCSCNNGMPCALSNVSNGRRHSEQYYEDVPMDIQIYIYRPDEENGLPSATFSPHPAKSDRQTCSSRAREYAAASSQKKPSVAESQKLLLETTGVKPAFNVVISS